MATVKDYLLDRLPVGVDIGQRQDPTAICVAEVEMRDDDDHYLIRRLERLPLGMPYPEVADRLSEIDQKLRDKELTPKFLVDATGVGQPVVDLLRNAGLRVKPVYLTGTDRAVEEDGELRLGKAPMVSRLQVLLQDSRIHLPKSAEAEALVDELLNYEIRISETAHAQFGAFRTGTHDDLATALGLACWQPPDWFSIGFAGG